MYVVVKVPRIVVCSDNVEYTVVNTVVGITVVKLSVVVRVMMLVSIRVVTTVVGTTV